MCRSELARVLVSVSKKKVQYSRSCVHMIFVTYFSMNLLFIAGGRFALMEVKLIIYNMLSRFTFKCTAQTEVPLKVKSSPFGLTPVNGLMLSIRRRK